MADDLPWGLVLPAARPSWAGVPWSLQRAQGELVSAEPLPKAEDLEESSTAGVLFFWSSSPGSSGGQRQGFIQCLKDKSCSGRALASLQGGSSEQRQCPWQLDEYLASSDIQELGNGLEVSRDPLSGR